MTVILPFLLNRSLKGTYLNLTKLIIRQIHKTFFKESYNQQVRSSYKIKTADDILASKYFCMIPWVHTHILPNSDIIPCCVSDYKDTFGNVKSSSISKIWNNKRYKTMRKMMLDDRAIFSCNKCYEVEESGVISMRKRINYQFQNRSDILEQTTGSGHHPDLKMRYFDIRFSNICNFKCRGCSPALSTKWYEDYQKLWNIKLDTPKLINAVKDNQSTWNEIEDYLPYVETAYFAGGEPLLMDEHYKCLERFIELGKTEIQLRYNTNLSILEFKKYNLIELWAKFKNINIGVSLDDIESRGEFFRSGLDWNNFISNFKKIKLNCPHIYFQVNVTVSLFNIHRLPIIHNYLYSEGLIDEFGMNFNLLLDPHEYRTQVLPKNDKDKIELSLISYIKQLKKKYPSKDWSHFESALINQIHFMRPQGEDLRQRFKDVTLKLDEIRKESFKDVYPELRHLIE